MQCKNWWLANERNFEVLCAMWSNIDFDAVRTQVNAALQQVDEATDPVGLHCRMNCVQPLNAVIDISHVIYIESRLVFVPMWADRNFTKRTQAALTKHQFGGSRREIPRHKANPNDTLN